MSKIKVYSEEINSELKKFKAAKSEYYLELEKIMDKNTSDLFENWSSDAASAMHNTLYAKSKKMKKSINELEDVAEGINKVIKKIKELDKLLGSQLDEI